jgi:hypothetical protein
MVAHKEYASFANEAHPAARGSSTVRATLLAACLDAFHAQAEVAIYVSIALVIFFVHSLAALCTGVTYGCA